MQFNFSNISTQYNQADAIASIAKENANAAQSNIASVYNSSALNLDAAVLSISTKGSARINAMLSKSIQLRATSVDPSLTTSDRQQVAKELREIHKEIDEIRSEDNTKKIAQKTEKEKTESTTELNVEDAEKMFEISTENILKHANECLQTQTINHESVMHLLQ